MIVELTDRQRMYLQAIVDAEGHMTNAGKALHQQAPNVTKMLRYIVEKSGRPMPAYKGKTQARAAADRVKICIEILTWSKPRPTIVERPQRGLEAKCHPERPDFAKGMCRECYREQRERSLVSGAEIDEERRERRDRLIMGSIDRSKSAPQKTIKWLSPTERQVLEIMATGTTNKEAAARMGISEQTIKNHLSGAYYKLGVSSIVQAFRKLGWLKVPTFADDEKTLLLTSGDDAVTAPPEPTIDASTAIYRIDEAMDDLLAALRSLGAKAS